MQFDRLKRPAGANPVITTFDELWGYSSERSRRLWPTPWLGWEDSNSGTRARAMYLRCYDNSRWLG